MSAVPEEALKIVSPADADPQETQEWLASLEGVLAAEGPERAHYLLEKLIEFARINGEHHPFSANTPYINTIPVDQQARIPGDQDIEHKIRSYTRWNAIAMVLRAGKDTNVGGHIASFASAATLYDVGFNHFWHAPSEKHGGDLVFVQGHSSPGVYSRAFLLGRLEMKQLENFRQEVDGGGLSSYPHPWLMPDFWQFPTVSMGLGPIMAIYQARFMKYLESRNIVKTEGRKVWAFLGDGETDEPESLGAIGMAGREQLDNLVFVINCNLQRLDGPVRGNGKIIQELESEFRGAGWNVIKVIWGSRWDSLLARDKKGLLMKRMMECVDGEYQTYKSKDGAYVREHFFNTPELKAMVADWSDEDIWALNRGGHDPHKIYAAYHAATQHKGQPTVILAKTIKGYGMGEAGQAMNITHQQKKMPVESLKKFRDQFKLPISDDEIADVPYLKFEEGSKELEYMRARRMELGGYLPQRRTKAASLPVPALGAFDALLKATAEGREISTTMAFVRILNVLLKDKTLGQRIVPIVPDESRTFGMEGLFRQIGIWSQVGQRYIPQDQDQLMFYKESENGQILQEGINEAGGMCDWIAAATSYSTHGETMIPFYIFYSMFGFQRIGDLAWAAGDMRARGFLVGGTAGRTTLNGEGLQHEDGHSLLWASSIPNCLPYDPTFAYELAVIVQDGLRRMVQEQEDVYYYLTVMNENYAHPAMPEGVEQDILKGMYSFRRGTENSKAPRVQLLGSGTIFNEVIAAAEMLKNDWGVESDLWSCPSFTELAREGNDVARYNLLHPTETPRLSHVEKCLNETRGPVIASTDYIRTYADQIRPFVRGRYVVLGTDGYGRSDTREKLRHFFEVDRNWVTVAALKALADEGTLPASKVAEAIAKYNLDPNKPNPMTV
ncbi:pyruvate dehydrogenase (acetyl-transferring), homodimeric type [Pandoraea nosoerga]|uniref:Pyruvate dehydrogenase E1 component n=1 Tax=Pandoraea nosoerga TaxID=2508296 RepID=A0A5E4X836_9BURK|nr:pyruvate dehydrogenase (acetyl-transferring), homodimeric type [Pandoraea nosoerga]MBN4665089.1 pyruvate dehydrogenase (acetyl-transferring), homodimeric type [Pandoraea nosoerga]MBN4675195.1 pyruvate dehydrogenase (acetyl-transferring), homodimeric type [Pandoraea nosoerga]MBN4680832.1 pyruvate dehydrogenase (acetyl-transferring), homodimeric type [Pandoraea nosoerga]MBN4744834.1 pyruvate dehydrogenase (acetyl-transferring), homodimeric type [Pandoraea nosoerga]VVE32315.1 pyruvate dehydrog